MRLIGEIEAGDDFRGLIERELAMRIKLDAARPATAGTSLPPSTCPSCETVNDDDAQFCKKCGAKLSAG
jgi:hypothetical protein